MVHKIFGWLGGYVRVRIRGENAARFVNLCRNHHMVLWKICREDGGFLSFCVALRDFYTLFTFSKKCRVRPVVVGRYGLPFLLAQMRKRASFFAGAAVCTGIVLFLSTRIWGICIEGQSYHTRESILAYLNSVGIYGGVAADKIECSAIEDLIRQNYTDIGWVSVEKSGSVLSIRLREVLLVSGQESKRKAHLVAQDSGTVVSIVTAGGTAKVRAGDTVKKGDILISGAVKIYGDNSELLEKDFVRAEGTVVLAVTKRYEDSLTEHYERKIYTGSSKSVHAWQIGSCRFFCHNPLNHLETFGKYDIIQESGQFCPFLSLRFPISHTVTRFQEIAYEAAAYSEAEAEKILQERFSYYLARQEKKGYLLQEKKLTLEKKDGAYCYSGTLLFHREQTRHKRIYKKNIVYEGNEAENEDGNGD